MGVLLAVMGTYHEAVMAHHDRDYDHIQSVVPEFDALWVASPASS